MSVEEKLIVVHEEDGEPTGETVFRSELIKDKKWGRSTNVFVLNPEGKILCHQRSFKKERYPGIWMTHFGGHVTEGESFKINALKEMEEELGIKVPAVQMIPWRTSRKDAQRLWMRDFLTVFAGDISTLEFQKSEIEQIKWFTAEEILEALDADDLPEDEKKDWKAGIYHFFSDYQCMRAVLTAALDMGIVGTDYHPLHKWQLEKKTKVQQ